MLASKEHCFLCFEALENKVKGQSSRVVRDFFEAKGDLPKFPLFVTWTKKQSLRGCIGCFNPLPLIKGLCDYAIIAGTQDTRFNPINTKELNQLECEVSLLHSFEKCKDALDWEVGKHGTTFNLDGLSSTFLPEVAEEQGWTRETTLKELAYKAGMRRELKQSDYPRISLERYQSSHIQATWAEYQQFLSANKA